MTLLATPLPPDDLSPASASHRPQLDALRALAVIAVLLVHFWPALPSFGQEAVRLFFVLSGFLITSQLLDGRSALGAQAPASGRWRVIGRFMARRALRIFPAYYVLLILLALGNAPEMRRDFVTHAAYASNLLAAAGIRRQLMRHYSNGSRAPKPDSAAVVCVTTRGVAALCSGGRVCAMRSAPTVQHTSKGQ